MARNYPECEWNLTSLFLTTAANALNVSEEEAEETIVEALGPCQYFVFTWITDAYAYSLLALYCIIIPLGFFGNLAIIFTVSTVSELQTVVNILLVSLACSDLLLTVTIPWTFLHNISYSYRQGIALCKLISPIQGTAVMSSILTMVLIAAERYRAILYPLQGRILNTGIRIKLSIALVWLFSACFQIPLPIVLDVQTFEGSDTVVPLAISVNVSVRACVESWSDDQALAFSYALLAILYIIPLLILIFLYSRIGYCMWKRRSVGERLNNNDQHSYNRRVRLVTLLVVLVALFAVLWGPYFVIQCLQLYKRPDYNPRVVGYLQMMGHANVAIDPLLYALFHQQIRKRMLIYVKRAKGFLCNWSIQLDSRVGAMSGTEQPEVDAVPDRGPNSALECQRNLQVIFSVDRNETVIGLTRTTKGSEDSIDSGRNGSIGSSLNLETYYTTTGVE